jgi:hypothetical protein
MSIGGVLKRWGNCEQDWAKPKTRTSLLHLLGSVVKAEFVIYLEKQGKLRNRDRSFSPFGYGFTPASSQKLRILTISTQTNFHEHLHLN